MIKTRVGRAAGALGAAVLVVTLAGCGRFGQLSLPPDANAAPDGKESAAAPGTAHPTLGTTSTPMLGSVGGTTALPPTPKGEKKHLPIDPMLE